MIVSVLTALEPAWFGKIFVTMVWFGRDLEGHLIPALRLTHSCFMYEDPQVILGA